jgi:hypothetical protein
VKDCQGLPAMTFTVFFEALFELIGMFQLSLHGIFALFTGCARCGLQINGATL